MEKNLKPQIRNYFKKHIECIFHEQGEEKAENITEENLKLISIEKDNSGCILKFKKEQAKTNLIEKSSISFTTNNNISFSRGKVIKLEHDNNFLIYTVLFPDVFDTNFSKEALGGLDPK